MDGVLVDVSGSFRRAVLETAAEFIGRPVDPGLVQAYKNRGGFNDDWKLTYTLVREAGVEASFDEVVERFQLRYRGRDWDGFIRDEPPLLTTATLRRIGSNGRLVGLVTGRLEAEATWTLDRFSWRPLFPLIVAAEHQQGRGKPDPFPLELAIQQLSSRGHPVQASESAYVGDSVDDVTSARAAGLWAIGFVPPYLDPEAHATLLKSHGAHAVVRDGDALAYLVDTFFEQERGEPEV